MNQTQRKYAIQRINELFFAKSREIRSLFQADPKNQLPAVAWRNPPADIEIIKVLCGKPSKATLKTDAQLLKEYSNYQTPGRIRLQDLCELQDPKEKAELEKQQTAVNARRKVMEDKILDLQKKADESKDAIMLSDEAEALKAIAAFTKILESA